MIYSYCNSCVFYSPAVGCCASFREAYDVCPLFDEDEYDDLIDEGAVITYG